MDEAREFEKLLDYTRQTTLLETTAAALEWDERTGLPRSAGAYRAEQLTHLVGLIHQRKTAVEHSHQIESLSSSRLCDQPNSPEAATVRRLQKDFDRNRRLPVELVQAISTATVHGQQAWELARERDDWNHFAPHMKEIFRLRREEAELLSDSGSRYDALLDQYEEDARSQQLTETFALLRDELVGLVREIGQSKTSPSGASVRRPVPIEKQRSISRWIAETIGFSFQRGRLDETTHPFCTTLGPNDHRILSRYQTDFFSSGFYSTLHEAGHGMYEQGLPTDWFGLAPGTAVSLGVHESQSRLWENFVGRSRAFWKWCLPEVRKFVGSDWDGLTPDDLFRDTNQVAPSLIRVEADEVTYNLHILIRFELEQDLLNGDIAIGDAPDAWNQRYEHYLGIRPTSPVDGILQDVHWSAGLIGYFPTYSLGNIFAAQLMQAAGQQLGDMDAMFSEGEFEPLLDWLRSNVHTFGACYRPTDLIEKATGESIDARPLIRYLRDKLEPIYSL